MESKLPGRAHIEHAGGVSLLSPRPPSRSAPAALKRLAIGHNRARE